MSLLSPETLQRRLGEPDLRICDVRWWLADPPKGRRDYAAAHVPGAIFIDVDTDLVAPEGPGRHPLPDPMTFARRLETLGIDDTSTVVAYDDAGGAVAARLWWMLDDLGHPDVHVLDGGIPAWIAAGGPLTAESPSYPPGHLTLRDHWTRVIDREDLGPRLAEVDGGLSLLDARAPERYRGDTEPIDPVAGHIPGAISRPLGGNLGPDGRFLPPAELRRRFEGLGSTVVDALAARGSTRATPRWRCGSRACRTRSSTPARTAIGHARGMPVATGDEPGRYDPG